MRQGGDSLGLALEAGQPVGVGGHALGQDLDGDLAIELRIPRAVDLAHAAGAEGREDLVGTESRACG